MNVEQVLKLVDAGFSKEEIAKMANVEQEKPAEQKQDENPKPPVEEKQEKGQEQGVETTLEQKFDKLMDILVKGNFTGANQPPESTVDDIIADIINPTRRKE